jgi:hypothetical protein
MLLRWPEVEGIAMPGIPWAENPGMIRMLSACIIDVLAASVIHGGERHNKDLSENFKKRRLRSAPIQHDFPIGRNLFQVRPNGFILPEFVDAVAILEAG